VNIEYCKDLYKEVTITGWWIIPGLLSSIVDRPGETLLRLEM